MNSKVKIQVIIASNHNLIVSGLQSFINLYAEDVDYLQFNSLHETMQYQNNSSFYLVLHHPLLESPKQDNLEKLVREFKGKVLLIGNERMNADMHEHLIFPYDNDETILTKLNDFFSWEQAHNENEKNDVLSVREIDILKEVALGYSNKEIADRLFISINTVITHRKNITEKLGIKTIAGLTVYALMNNLIDPNDVTVG